jgi:hypothetical protein
MSTQITLSSSLAWLFSKIKIAGFTPVKGLKVSGGRLKTAIIL